MYHNSPILDNLGFMRVKYLFLTIALLAFKAVAVEVVLEPVKAFPVAKQFEYENGQPSTVIATSPIVDEDGKLARGPHTINFTLAAGSSYAVMINDNRVEPGETYSFVQNLTTSAHKLTLPIYPANGGIEGLVNYTIDIPNVRSLVCLSGQQELEDGCMTTTYDVLAINCSPEYTSNTSDGIQCLNYVTAPITLYCEDEYDRNGDTCTKVTINPAEYNCTAYAGTALQGAMCILKETKPVSKCKAGFTNSGGQCRVVVNSYNAPSGCNSFQVWNGSKCEQFSSTNHYYWQTSSCGSKIERFGTCYVEVGGWCPSGYTHGRERCTETVPVGPHPIIFKQNCHEGNERFGFACYHMPTPPTLTCKSPSVLNMSNNMCEWTSYADAVRSCPSGGELYLTECFVYNYEQHGNYCLSGGEYNAATTNCETDLSELADRNCVGGFVMEADGESCELIDNYDFKNCADDTFSPDDAFTTCERTLTEVPVLECGEGYEIDEIGVQCVKSEKLPFI
jgi:hypothetical protein